MNYQVQVNGGWMDCVNPETLKPATFATRGGAWQDIIARSRALKGTGLEARYRIVKTEGHHAMQSTLIGIEPSERPEFEVWGQEATCEPIALIAEFDNRADAERCKRAFITERYPEETATALIVRNEVKR